MGKSKRANHKGKDSRRLKISASEIRGRKSAAQSWLRSILIFGLTAGVCLTVGKAAAVAPSLLNSDAAGVPLYHEVERYDASKGTLVADQDYEMAAVEIPPTASPWYYGTAFPEDDPNSANDRAGYRDFKDAHVDRRSVVYLGARDGMLHAFDAGAFHWMDTDNDTTTVDEKRGLFDWGDLSGSGVTYCNDITHCPDYGTGEELWPLFRPTCCRG